MWAAPVGDLPGRAREVPVIFKPETAKACVFDMFGTLFNVHSCVAACQEHFGPEGADFSAQWRRRQLEYSWLRAGMKRYVPFWQLTRDALDVTLREYGRAADLELRNRLLDAYLRIEPYPDSGPALAALGKLGVRATVLTNGSRDMTESALSSSGLRDRIEEVMSADDVRTFKPDPAMYAMAPEVLGVEPHEIVFISAHPWDLAGATLARFQTLWVNRTEETQPELLGFGPHLAIASLSELPGKFSSRQH